MNVSYDAYRAFYFVAQCQSFTKAAQMLYSNQPNVTRTIKNLEEALGCRLFIRSNHGVQLTPEGEALLLHIRPAMEQIQAGEEAVIRHTHLQDGVVSIASSEVALQYTLLPVLKQFRKRYPKVRLRIYNSTTPQTVAALKERLVDLALVTTPVETGTVIQVREVTSFQEVPVCGGAFAFLKEETLSLERLLSYPLVGLGKGTATYGLYRDFFRQYGLSFSPDIEAATFNQIIPMVRADLGIGFVPERTALQESDDNGIYVLNTCQPLPKRSVCLLKRKGNPLSIAAHEMEKMIFQEME